MADLTDRHYALFANNQHPLQIATYNAYNSFIQDLHDKATAERAEAEADEFQRAVDARKATLNEAEGESLSIDDLSEVYIQVRGDARARNNMDLNTTLARFEFEVQEAPREDIHVHNTIWRNKTA